MSKFYVTFGQKYRHEEHPIFGMRSSLPDGYFTIEAPSIGKAHEIAVAALGTRFSSVYPVGEDYASDGRHFYPAGNFGDLLEAVEEAGKHG